LEPTVARKGEADKIIDLRGMSCPWSILKAKSQLIAMKPGEVLEVLASDPLMFEDFPKVLCQSGHHLVEINRQPGYSRLYVKRGQKEKNSHIAGCKTGIDDSETKRR
jgi:tRNA 2-thiouridine synthesizing protein A